MAIDILMPALSPTMEEGTLAKWHVKTGDTVESGDIIAEIETDKAVMEFEAVDEGVIEEILVSEGTTSVKVNAPIARLSGDDDAAPAPAPIASAAPATPAPAAAPVVTPAPSAPPKSDGERVFASPLARRLAAERDIDLSTLKGSGPHGRIVRADLDAAPATSAAKASGASVAPAQPIDASSILAPYADRPHEVVELDGMRRTIATRLQEAKQTIPHFYLRRDIILDPLLAFRKEMNAALEASGKKLSINDFIIKASALALQDVPDCNAIWVGDKIAKLTPSDVAVAVAIDGGLFTPVIKDADTKTMSAISAEMKDLAARARDRKLAPHEYQGGSFAISNLGMMGIENFDAVINPPHGSILAVGAGVRKPIVGEDGEIAVATAMSVTLSVDHRVIDGALGAEFVAALKTYLENPISMLA